MLGRTHWDVDADIRRIGNDTIRRFGGSWNTYERHGLAPALGERRTLDYWNPPGRGHTLDEARGDAIVAWTLGQHQVDPVMILIWWSWIWLPQVGWRPYSGFQGNHGPGRDAHVHVGYR